MSRADIEVTKATTLMSLLFLLMLANFTPYDIECWQVVCNPTHSPVVLKIPAVDKDNVYIKFTEHKQAM